MAKLQLRGEYVRNILAGYDQMEKDTRNPANALQAAQANIVPAEFVMAHLCASIMWFAKRHSIYLTEQLAQEIIGDLKLNDKKIHADFEQRINKMIEEAANKNAS